MILYAVYIGKSSSIKSASSADEPMRPIAGSSNGRIVDSESTHLGSNPSPAAKLRRQFCPEAVSRRAVNFYILRLLNDFQGRTLVLKTRHTHQDCISQKSIKVIEPSNIKIFE